MEHDIDILLLTQYEYIQVSLSVFSVTFTFDIAKWYTLAKTKSKRSVWLHGVLI